MRARRARVYALPLAPSRVHLRLLPRRRLRLLRVSVRRILGRRRRRARLPHLSAHRSSAPPPSPAVPARRHRCLR
eukprot:5475840-Pleurochrysis_carterae.AAC.1